MASVDIDMPTLGRPVDIGMLYNICTDKFLSGVLLWDKDAIDKNTLTQPKPSTRFTFTVEDSLDDKTKVLDINASLKASFLMGLVEVGGSAQYLQNRVSSTRQCRVTMNYNVETDYKYIYFDHLGEMKHPEVFEQKTATHVVIRVTYGAKAFMVFDQEVSEEEDKQKIQGQLGNMVKKISAVQISGEGRVDLTNEDKTKVNSIRCSFFGDFILDHSPSSYEEAVLVYKKLPAMLGEKGERAVPVKMLLYPLKNLNTNAAELVREIRADLVSEVGHVMETFHEAKIRASDLIKQCQVIKAATIEEKLRTFEDKLDFYSIPLRKNLGKVLPAIRAGKEDDQKLQDILTSHRKSSFSYENMKKWLDEKDTEILKLRNYIDPLCNKFKVEVVPPGPELSAIKSNPTIKWLHVLYFTSLDDDPFVPEQSDRKDGVSFARKCSVKKKAQACSDELLRESSKALSDFKKHAGSPRHRHIISYMPDAEKPGVHLSVSKKGRDYNSAKTRFYCL